MTFQYCDNLISFKTMRTIPNLFKVSMAVIVAGLVISCSGNKTENTTSTADTASGESGEWITLFDGETLSGWKRYNADSIGPLWKVEDGVIVCSSTGGGEAEGMGGSLITLQQFGNFELTLDYKLSPEGNSGILYHVVEADSFPHAYNTGPEFQLLDDSTSAYGQLKPEQMTAANYDMYAPNEAKKTKPVGEWNTVKIIYNNGQVEHWLNGEKVLEFEEGSEEWQQRHENSKWVDFPGWCKYKSGSIALQDHGNMTWFRNVKVREL